MLVRVIRWALEAPARIIQRRGWHPGLAQAPASPQEPPWRRGGARPLDEERIEADGRIPAAPAPKPNQTAWHPGLLPVAPTPGARGGWRKHQPGCPCCGCSICITVTGCYGSFPLTGATVTITGAGPAPISFVYGKDAAAPGNCIAPKAGYDGPYGVSVSYPGYRTATGTIAKCVDSLALDLVWENPEVCVWAYGCAGLPLAGVTFSITPKGPAGGSGAYYGCLGQEGGGTCTTDDTGECCVAAPWSPDYDCGFTVCVVAVPEGYALPDYPFNCVPVPSGCFGDSTSFTLETDSDHICGCCDEPVPKVLHGSDSQAGAFTLTWDAGTLNSTAGCDASCYPAGYDNYWVGEASYTEPEAGITIIDPMSGYACCVKLASEVCIKFVVACKKVTTSTGKYSQWVAYKCFPICGGYNPSPNPPCADLGSDWRNWARLGGNQYDCGGNGFMLTAPILLPCDQPIMLSFDFGTAVCENTIEGAIPPEASSGLNVTT